MKNLAFALSPLLFAGVGNIDPATGDLETAISAIDALESAVPAPPDLTALQEAVAELQTDGKATQVTLTGIIGALYYIGSRLGGHANTELHGLLDPPASPTPTAN